MRDYDLTSLSTDLFEKLVEELCASPDVMGPGIVFFGDGPGAGREASYDGLIPYPSPDRAWNGYIVVQTKFRQQPLGPTEDCAWALGQLKGELEAFADKSTGRGSPQYYIFVTNTLLSPIEHGCLDSLHNLLAAYRKRLGLRNYAIWDYATLCTMLDANDDVRRRYAAFITPASVFAIFIQRD